MAEKIVSPGVFTNEKDLSFLPAGIAAIGAAIVGPTQKGPAFVPTVVTSFNDFVAKFGGLSEETYIPYAVKSYLKNASTVTVVRVLQEGGYNIPNAFSLIYSGSLGFRVVGVALPSAKNSTNGSNGVGLGLSSITSSVGVNGSSSLSGSFRMTLGGSSFSTLVVSASAVPTSNISFDRVLGTSVKSNQNAYDYLWFSDFLGANVNQTGAIISSSIGNSLNLSGSVWGTYRPARTPYVTSQLLDGQSPKTLFRFFNLSDGTDTNTQFKVSIINQTLPTSTSIANFYGTFTVLVRDFNDTDQRPIVLESYNNLDLDPNSANFIARRIGDRYNQVNTADNSIRVLGDYPNVSAYLRVDLDSDVKNGGTSFALFPKGFQAVTEPFAGPFSLPSASYTTQDLTINGAFNTKAYYGWNFSANDNDNYLKALPSGSGVGLNVNFNLDNCFFHPSGSAVDSNTTGYTGGASVSGSSLRGLDISNVLKFSVPFQDGFNGDDPALPKYVGSSITNSNTQGLNCTNANSAGSQAYFKALNIIQNSEQYDMNLLVTPGITIANHASVVAKALDVAETRGDTFYIADPVIQNQSLATAVSAVANSGIDSSYMATYWPWVKIMDTDRNKPVWVPPSVVLPNIYAYNDNVAFEWFAPAGLNRGGITEAVDIETKLTFSQRDSLYDNKINPIATFPGQGICVWGQKTLQVKASALDRINVRRLLIAMKKFVASSTRYLVFENNTTETRQRFLNIVNPYLERVKARQGLYAFRVVMDETNNTPDVIDRNQMYGQIFLQPAKTAEFIILDFNILPTGASFENA